MGEKRCSRLVETRSRTPIPQPPRPKAWGERWRKIGGVICGRTIAPMTRARNHTRGSGNLPIIQLLPEAVLRVFVSLAKGVRTTLQMWWRKGQRDWDTRSETSALPTATSGIHLQERNHTCRSERPRPTRSAARCALRAGHHERLVLEMLERCTCGAHR